jgi:hypothetical protein
VTSAVRDRAEQGAPGERSRALLTATLGRGTELSWEGLTLGPL